MNPHAGDPGACRGCGQVIVWRLNDNGRLQPFDPNGDPHHAGCPASWQFRKPAKAATPSPQAGLWTESHILPIQTSRCAGCFEILIWHPEQGLVDYEDGAPHRLSCSKLRRSERNVRMHTHPCKHCQAAECTITSDSRGELHRCTGCSRWREIVYPAASIPRGGSTS